MHNQVNLDRSPTLCAVQAIRAGHLLLLLLAVLDSEPATCRLLIRGRKLAVTHDSAAAVDSGYSQPDTTASSSQAWDTSTPAASGIAAPWTGSSSSSSSSSSNNGVATSSQPWTYSLRGSTAAANTYTGSSVAAGSYTRTYRQPCSYGVVCQHYGRCVAYGWTFTCDCPEGWGGWYCEKPVAARNTVLGAIPSVPSLAPQPDYSSGTLPATTSSSGSLATATWQPGYGSGTLAPQPGYSSSTLPATTSSSGSLATATWQPGYGSGTLAPQPGYSSSTLAAATTSSGLTAPSYTAASSTGAWAAAAAVPVTSSQLGIGFTAGGLGASDSSGAYVYNAGVQRTTVGDGGAVFGPAAWPAAAAAAAGRQLGSDTGSGTAGLTQQAPGTVTGGVTRPNDTGVPVTPTAAPQHDTGEDPRLDDGMGVTSDISSRGTAGTGADVAAAVSKQGPSPVDVRPPIIGVVAPVG
ncbi:hypothetical protein OEZ86_007425 [Tetradesmus obliquus]|nr:hypothetical protein OEZ86_007425 [Tetradesmus obliquus]